MGSGEEAKAVLLPLKSQIADLKFDVPTSTVSNILSF
jgi:hypothetical protein